MTFRFAKAALWGLVLCTGALAVLGVLSLFGDPAEPTDAWRGPIIAAFAGMVFCSLCVSQVAAACAQQLTGETPWARGLAYGCAAVTGLASVAGVFLGDAVLRGDHPELPPLAFMIAGAFVLSFVKQAMSFVITACEGDAKAAAAAQDHVLAAKDARIAQLERELAQVKKASQDKPVSPVSPPRRASGHAARSVARAMEKEEPTGSSGRIAPVEQALCQTEFRDVSLSEVEDACREIMLRRDADDQPVTPSLRLVASQCKVPKGRVEKCLTQHQLKLATVVERLAAA